MERLKQRRISFLVRPSGGASGDVVLGGLVAVHAEQSDAPQGAVGVAVAPSSRRAARLAEPMAVNFDHDQAVVGQEPQQPGTEAARALYPDLVHLPERFGPGRRPSIATGRSREAGHVETGHRGRDRRCSTWEQCRSPGTATAPQPLGPQPCLTAEIVESPLRYGSEGWGSSPSECASDSTGRHLDHGAACSSSSSSGLVSGHARNLLEAFRPVTQEHPLLEVLAGVASFWCLLAVIFIAYMWVRHVRRRGRSR